jgi:ubiquinone/menaquinone biosynthesis C-methylase UbiE
MKYLNPSFSVAMPSNVSEEDWDAAFGKPQSAIVCHNCSDKYLANGEVVAIQTWLQANVSHGHTTLDVGCGDSKDGERIFGHHQYKGIDQTEGVDAKLLPFEDRSFFLVLMKRILCQHGPVARKQIISEAKRVCKPGGYIIVCEPWLAEYGNLNRLRTTAGLAPLPSPQSGGNFLEEKEFLPLKRVADLPIESSYIYWTRFLYERITGKMLAYDDESRQIYPIISGANRVDPYRAKVFSNV